ncbi:SufS family cysteine desulfurase [Planctomycetota bacterium]
MTVVHDEATAGTCGDAVGPGPSPRVERARADFPALERRIHGSPLVYLDSAATSLKPQPVIDRIAHFYAFENANIHRGIHQLSEEATRLYEGGRQALQRFLNAEQACEIVFCRSTTEAINLVAQTFGVTRVGPGDEVLVTGMEHHANIVPWQMLCERKGATLRVIPVSDRGELVLDSLGELLTGRTRIVAVTHVSNALGTVNPVREIVGLARQRGIPVLVDGAQAVPHMRVDVRDLDCDFYAFSGHKMLGPTGIGALYGRASLLQEMPPYQGGGDMIRSVSFEGTTYREIPFKFEAGTPHIAGVVGLAAAVDYLETIGWEAIASHEAELLRYCTQVVSAIPGLRLVGEADEKAAVLSFVLEGIHAHDVGTILDSCGVAVRAGHHCAQPLMERFGLSATVRASLAFYNNRSDIDALVRSIHRAWEVFS